MKSGSKIDGYWVFWPFHGSEHARRFETLEDAQAYLPIKKGNKGRKLPLGPRLIWRVGWGLTSVTTGAGEWRCHPIETLSQEEVEELFFKTAEEVAKDV